MDTTGYNSSHHGLIVGFFVYSADKNQKRSKVGGCITIDHKTSNEWQNQ